MKKQLSLFFFLFSFFCFSQENNTSKKLIDYVNPFIGTGGHGHTYPGATMPFGMMQLSPDTRLEGWDGCSGYHYSDEYIYGFSHTHLSGTGISDYGDVLLMPTNTVNFNNGSDGKSGYRAHFSHENEIASPGYYKVLLDDTNIEVELTVSKRSGKADDGRRKTGDRRQEPKNGKFSNRKSTINNQQSTISFPSALWENHFAASKTSSKEGL